MQQEAQLSLLGMFHKTKRRLDSVCLLGWAGDRGTDETEQVKKR